MVEDVLELGPPPARRMGSTALVIALAVASVAGASGTAVAGLHPTVDGSGSRIVPVHVQHQPLTGRKLI